MSQKSFYHHLLPFKDFSTVLNDSHYVSAPSDWYILLTDVRGSTKAIEQGRYKQVNMIGAASITCVLNTLGYYDIPFVFGGDGATLLIPPESVPAISDQLKRLQHLSLTDFQLELRVGLVSLKHLSYENCFLKISKYELSPGNCLAQFRGGALTRAEEMVKKNLEGAVILKPNDHEPPPNLDGLSCRLNPLKSQKGIIFSIICKPKSAENAEVVLQDILDRIKFIVGDDFKLASPVTQNSLSWNLLPKSIISEAQTARKPGMSFTVSLLKTFFKALIANLSIKLGFSLGDFKPQKYKDELILNSDFQKFDEMLRMVVDCTREQSIVIENLLTSNFEKNRIYYGLHKSEDALMTCMVFSASQNQHIHFIDGAQGGYAFAATGLKKQIADAQK